VSLLLVAGRVVAGVAQLALDGRITALFAADEEFTGTVDSNVH
jgi:hypothetical protein